MAFKTLSQLRTLVRQHADIENDGAHTSDAEIDSYINTSTAFLYSLLTDGTDGSLFAKNAGVLTKIGDNAYQLPGDFSQLIDVSVKTGATYINSVAADPQDYAQLTLANSTSYSTQHYLQWNVAQGRGELFIFPTPTSTDDVAVRYVPEAPALSLDADTLNFPSFWYQWVVLDSAIQCTNKEESNPQALHLEREKVERRIRDHIRSMAISTVKTIRKIRQTRHRATPPINYGS